MKRRLISLSITFVITAIVLLLFWRIFAYQGKIYSGVLVNGYDVGGMTSHEAGVYLKKTLPAPRYLDISANNFHRRLNLTLYGAAPNFSAAADRAYRVGRESWWLNNLSAILLSRLKTTAIKTDYFVDKTKIKRELKIIAIQINQPPVDARRVVSGDRIALIRGQTGYKLKIDEAVNNISRAIAENRSAIPLPVVKKSPKIKVSFLKKQHIDSLLAHFQTALKPSQSQRNINIKIASEKIDGTILPAGAVFSFDEIVGKRTRANGFKVATEIRNGNLAKGVGGGICQVATTLYNSFMLAGLPTVERHIHSNYIAAYPTGRDASIAEGRYDLRFKNDTNGSILIKAMADGKRLVVNIYGPKTGRTNIFSEPKVFKKVPYRIENEIDDRLPPGIKLIVQKGVTGRSITLNRYVKSADGGVLFKEKIVSRYQPRTEIIKSGPPQ